MKKALFLESVPSEFKSRLLNPSVGVNGKVYKVKDEDLAFKSFGDMTEFETDFIRLSMFQSDTFVFPRTLVYVKDRLIGYLMEYVNGNTLSELSCDTDFAAFIKALEALENEIKNLSFQGMELVDLNQNNIMYTPTNRIKVVDTDLYQFPRLTEEDILKLNYIEYNGFIIPRFLTEEDTKFFPKTLLKYYRYTTVGGRMPARRFLEELKAYLENVSGKEQKTIGDAKQTLALIRKK